VLHPLSTSPCPGLISRLRVSAILSHNFGRSRLCFCLLHAIASISSTTANSKVGRTTSSESPSALLMHRTFIVFRCARPAISTSTTRRLLYHSITQPRVNALHAVNGSLHVSSLTPVLPLSTSHHHMSNLPTKPTVSFPSRPESSNAATTVSSSHGTTPSLLSRISHTLPARPAFVPQTTRQRSPVHRAERSDSQYETRRSDYYRPRSLTPERRADSYRPVSPARNDWDRRDSYIPRSPSPPPRYRTFERSVSPVKRQESPVKELPKTFFTHAHKKAEGFAAKAAARREESEAAHKAREEARSAARPERDSEYNQSVECAGPVRCLTI